MNLAVSSLIIFLLLSPAILARRLYYTRELSRNYVARNTLQEIFSSIILAFLLHLAWISMFRLSDKIDYELLIKVLLGPEKGTDYGNITDNPGRISFYFLSLGAISAIGAVFAKGVIRKNGWDRVVKFLEYDNKWSYFSTGEIVDIGDYKKVAKIKFKEISVRIVDVLSKSSNGVRYTGALIDFQLEDNNSLDYLVLSEPIIKTTVILSENQGDVVKFIEEEIIESNCFVIPYSDILNINFRYLNANELNILRQKAQLLKNKADDDDKADKSETESIAISEKQRADKAEAEIELLQQRIAELEGKVEEKKLPPTSNS